MNDRTLSMRTLKVTFTNDRCGIHARAAAAILRFCMQLEADVRFCRHMEIDRGTGRTKLRVPGLDVTKVNAKSIMGLLNLSLCYGCEVYIEIEHPEEAVAGESAKQLREFFESDWPIGPEWGESTTYGRSYEKWGSGSWVEDIEPPAATAADT